MRVPARAAAEHGNLQEPGERLRRQGQGCQRVIYRNGNHPPSAVRLRHGDSRSRLEGNTLVVETTNFLPKFPFRGAAEDLTVVERFTRLDAMTLEYAVTITDPTVWTAPWTVKQELALQSDDQNRIYYEPQCHEGSIAGHRQLHQRSAGSAAVGPCRPVVPGRLVVAFTVSSKWGSQLATPLPRR